MTITSILQDTLNAYGRDTPKDITQRHILLADIAENSIIQRNAKIQKLYSVLTAKAASIKPRK